MIIETSAFNTLIVVTFKNTSTNQFESNVFASKEIAEREIAKLEGMPHIEIICKTDATVVSQ